MIVLLVSLLISLPPPWVPPQPIQPPLIVEYAGGGYLTVIPRSDGAIVSFTPHTERLCFVITARDGAGQEYHYQERRGCGFVTFAPLVERN